MRAQIDKIMNNNEKRLNYNIVSLEWPKKSADTEQEMVFNNKLFMFKHTWKIFWMNCADKRLFWC